MRPVDLNDLLSDTMKMLRQTLPKAITLDSELAPELYLIKAIPEQLEQLVMNLATNANDAMPEGGILRMTTENVTIEGPTESVDGEPVSNDYVRVSISDTGHGMSPQVLERIFDPFFTTKEIGKGTGLGLYTAYTTVQNHGGQITCKSVPGEGTTFEVTFRAVQGEVQWPKVEDEQKKEARRAEGMLLLVDDEPGILLGTSEMLKLKGFETLTASSGEEALDRYDHYRDAIDMVLVDLGMPGMGGLECIRRLIRRNPEVKIVVASGYPEEKEGGLATKAGAKKFIKKPYRMDALIEIIHQVLEDDE
jgi:CheY-like chemotaxis protein